MGGLLKVTDYGGGTTHHFVAYDGNGNVLSLNNGTTAATTARYEYGPFGETIRVTATKKKNPFRFSTKFTDNESGLVYYGFRYYNPVAGRWLSRDPLKERGGHNLYAFVGNSAVTHIDVLGLTQWHHRLPQEFEIFFQSLNIDIHDSKYGTFLSDVEHSQLHNLKESAKYNDEWRKFIDELRADSGLTPQGRQQKVLDFLEEIESRPKYRCLLQKGVAIPSKYRYPDYDRMTPQEKNLLFRSVFGRAGRVASHLSNAAKAGGKVVKAVGLAFIPSAYGQGRDYAGEVYASGPVGQAVAGGLQVVLPMGPADASATWDMTQAEVAETNTGWKALAETLVNPTSPRFLIWQIARGAKESLYGE